VSRGNNGFVEIFSLILVSFLMFISFYLFQEIMMHRRVGNAYVRNIQEDYLLEGVLAEAKHVREKKENIDPNEKISSIFCPDYKFYFGNDTIYINKGVSTLLSASYIIYNGKVIITSIKSQSNTIYVRE